MKPAYERERSGEWKLIGFNLWEGIGCKIKWSQNKFLTDSNSGWHGAMDGSPLFSLHSRQLCSASEKKERRKRMATQVEEKGLTILLQIWPSSFSLGRLDKSGIHGEIVADDRNRASKRLRIVFNMDAFSAKVTYFSGEKVRVGVEWVWADERERREKAGKCETGLKSSTGSNNK